MFTQWRIAVWLGGLLRIQIWLPYHNWLMKLFTWGSMWASFGTSGFVSRTLLKRHERFEGCPTLTFEQSREGFRAFVDRIGECVPIEQATILYVRYHLERSGR